MSCKPFRAQNVVRSFNRAVRGTLLEGILACGLVLRAALSLAPASAAETTELSPSPDVPAQSSTKPTAEKSIAAASAPARSASNGLVFSGELMDTLDSKQKLAVGDTVMFRVLEDQEDFKALSVTDTGELHVPELGLVSALGKTCKELAFELKPKLEQTTYYRATVIIGIQVLNKTISGRRVYLAGQVRVTGPQEIPAGETWTVSRAIMGAGGFTEYADKKQVRLVRGGSRGTPGKTVILNIAAVWEKGQTEKDLSVEPEDLIYVPARGINF